MKLGEWIAARGLNRSSFGRMIGERPMTIARYCLPEGHPHQRIPKAETMRKIVAATGGAVMPNDFYGVTAEVVPVPGICPPSDGEDGAGDPAGPAAPAPAIEAAE